MLPLDAQEIEILYRIRKFYPIGRPNRNDEYPDFQLIRDSIAKRINKFVGKERLEPGRLSLRNLRSLSRIIKWLKTKEVPEIGTSVFE